MESLRITSKVAEELLRGGRLKGEKIIILHGWSYSTEKWQPFIALLKENGLNPILLKIPGLTEKIDKPWMVEDYVQWLRKIIDKQKNNNLAMKQFSNDIILLGHSNGGRIALNFAVKYPNSIAQLILIDSAGIYHNDLAISFKRYVFKCITEMGKKLSSSEKLRNLLYKVVGESDYKNATPVMRKTMVNLIDSDKRLRLDKISVRTLITWGENDKITPLSDGKTMNKLIKESKLYVVKGTKHSPQFTNVEEVADIILKYLKAQIAKVKATA